jgi:alkylation response protein AidB-like acyl-CoA dehydrogenase
MDFGLTAEQEMLLESTRRYVGDHYSFEKRRALLSTGNGCSRGVWNDLAALGVLSVNVPEEHGGLGAGPVESMLIALALGEGLVVEPFLTSAVIATRLIALAGSAAQREQWLPALASGERIAVLAHGGGDDPSAVMTRATAEAGGWTIDGRQMVVYHAPVADLLLVTAQVDDPHGKCLGLFAVPRESTGVSLDSYRTLDDQPAADVAFAGVQVGADARLGGDAAAAVAEALDFGLAIHCADAVGVLDRALAVTIEYVRTRTQFGGPIGRFQALQHRIADMAGHIENARSMSYVAAVKSAAPDPRARARALSAAKVIIGQAARFVGQQAVQLHGGMGVSNEVAISHYFRRLTASEIRFGSGEHHLDRYAGMMTDS